MTTTTTTTPADLQELADRNRLATLVSRLGACLDEGRFDDMRDLFAADATARTPGGQAEGRDALVAQASRNHSPGRRIQHMFSDVIADLDGDRADVRANALVTFGHGPDVAGPRFTMGERYRLHARRTPEGWQLTAVETTPVWQSGTRPGAEPQSPAAG